VKYVILSDVHANLEALESCFKKIDELKPDKIICLGDLVDYCAQPNECVEIIKSRCDVVILGNHDEAQFNYTLADGFSEHAKISSIKTRDIVEKKFVEYFKTLSLTYSENNFLFVHGSPLFPMEYNYVLTKEDAKLNFSGCNEKICFIGHSHRPILWELKENKVSHVSKNKLDENSRLYGQARYIINVGSIGQPRDGDPRASFGFYNSEKMIYENIRVEYNIDYAARKIIDAGLPKELAERLFHGR